MGRALSPASRQLWQVKEQFLAGGDVTAQVRPEIEASWRRSVQAGVLPDRVEPLYTDVDSTSPLYNIAQPVITRQAERLNSADTVLLLADDTARILARWTADSTLNRALDSAGSVPGSCLAEEIRGTNGLGTVFAERKPMRVSGPEHYAECYTEFACIGVPICHPITGNMHGAITVVIKHGRENNLVLPFAQLLREEIERRMADQVSQAERALLNDFLETRSCSNHPVIAVSDRYLLADANGLSTLGEITHDQLWERLVNDMPYHATGATSIPWDRDDIQPRVHPVRCDGRFVGAVLEMHSASTQTTTPPVDSSVHLHPRQRDPIAALPGRGRGWLECVQAVRRATQSHACLLLTGEPGAGKLTLLRAAAASATGHPEPFDVLDAALLPVYGLARWLHEIRERLTVPNGWMVLRHLDLLDERAAQALGAVIDQQAESARPRIGVTMTLDKTTNAPPSRLQPCLDQLSAVRIDLPALRERPDDVRRIAEDALYRLHPNGTRRLTDEAVQALQRAPWPDNVRQLEAAIRNMAIEPGSITVDRLPPEIRNAGEPHLARLDRLQREAILSALREAGGNKTAAAADLGISRSTLYRHLRTFRISPH